MSEIEITEPTKKRLIKCPTLPNFIKVVHPEQTISIGDLTEDQIREIGAKWTVELIKKQGKNEAIK